MVVMKMIKDIQHCPFSIVEGIRGMRPKKLNRASPNLSKGEEHYTALAYSTILIFIGVFEYC